MTDEELSRLCEFLYRRTGMLFGEAKRYYVQRRIGERMAATGAATFASYFARLRGDVGGEVEQFINAFTVNETYFYREEHQLQCLTRDLLAERLAAKPRGGNIRIWSVPFATGEEPYSIAIWLLENWPPVDAHDVEIVGSDIDTDVLEAARMGVFGKRALMRLSPDLVARYFDVVDDDHWRVIEDLRQSVRFSAVNLVSAAETRPHGRFDVVFCRNVLIYFDDASRRVAAENLYETLSPGGFICLGHSESMSRISPLFDVRRYADAIVYLPRRASVVEARRKRVLVIDDAHLVRRYYRAPLESAGFEVEEALNGLEALEKLLAEPPDLLVVDINMPRMDGITFLKALRRQAMPVAATPALVISTESGPRDFASARAAGANFYLTKPVKQRVLALHAAMLCGVPT
jgi:chemotaxis protein methyltransferase CheR